MNCCIGLSVVVMSDAAAAARCNSCNDVTSGCCCDVDGPEVDMGKGGGRSSGWATAWDTAWETTCESEKKCNNANKYKENNLN